MCSNRRDEAIIDTVVLHYFLLVARHDLLIGLLGRPIHVPRVVFDPDEALGTPPAAMSELTRGIDRHHRRARDRSLSPVERKLAAESAGSLEVAHRLSKQGDLVVTETTDEERVLLARLMTRGRVAELGVRFPLGAGEAAGLAIAVHRGWTFVTDDNDALRVLEHLRPGHPYLRTRRLLRQASEEGLLTRAEANDVHQAMRIAGFWDKEAPFPAG